MKYLIAAAIVCILVVAPIISYCYLQSGLKYRLQAQEELRPKEVSDELQKQLSIIQSEPTAKLIHIDGDDLTDEVKLLASIDERIVDRTLFEIYSYADAKYFSEDSNIKLVSEPDLSSLTEHDFILIDTAGVVRCFYDYTPELAKTLIKHLSVVIPLPENREITLRREPIQ